MESTGLWDLQIIILFLFTFYRAFQFFCNRRQLVFEVAIDLRATLWVPYQCKSSLFRYSVVTLLCSGNTVKQRFHCWAAWVFLQPSQFNAASVEIEVINVIITEKSAELNKNWMCLSSCSNNILTCMFSLVMQYYLDPPLRLREALEQKGLKPDCFFTLHHGESRLICAQDEDVFDWCAVFLWPVSMDLSVTKCSKFITCRIPV